MFRDKRFEVVCSDGKHRTETVKDLLLIIHILCTTQTVPLPIVRLANPLNFQSSHQPAVLLRCQLFIAPRGLVRDPSAVFLPVRLLSAFNKL